MAHVEDVFVDNDNLVRVRGATDAATGAYVNNATGTLVVEHSSGAVVQASSPTTYVAASDGDYDGVIDHETPLVAGEEYVAVVTVDAGAGRISVLNQRLIARVRYT